MYEGTKYTIQIVRGDKVYGVYLRIRPSTALFVSLELGVCFINLTSFEVAEGRNHYTDNVYIELDKTERTVHACEQCRMGAETTTGILIIYNLKCYY